MVKTKRPLIFHGSMVRKFTTRQLSSVSYVPSSRLAIVYFLLQTGYDVTSERWPKNGGRCLGFVC